MTREAAGGVARGGRIGRTAGGPAARAAAVAATALVLAALGGCAGTGYGTGGKADTGGATDLIGTGWRLVNVDLGGPQTVVLNEPLGYVLQLQPGARLGVRADCVTCVGAYTVGGHSLQMQLDCPSIIGCGPGSFAQQYLDLLEQVRTFERDGDRLRLYTLDSSRVLTFERTAGD